MERAAILLGVGVVVTSLCFVACKSDEEASGGKSGAGGGGAGGAGGSAGAAGVAAIHPPPGCFKGSSQCNPLTNAPCKFSEACDILSEDGGTELVCFPPPNLRPIGGICHLDDGPWCASELHCNNERCVRFCCSNADCPDAGACTPFDSNNGTLGTCPLPPDGGT